MSKPSPRGINVWVALLRLGAIAVFALGVILAFRFTPLGSWLSPEALESAFRSLGPAAIPAFILLYAVLTAMWVPGTIMTIAGAALFGRYVAIPVNYTGAVIGAWLGFHASQWMGGDALDHLLGGRLRLYDRYKELIRTRGFESILYLRLIPTPYNAVSYLAGLSPISATRFTLATAIGIIPGSVAISFFMGTVIEEIRAGDWSALFSLRLLAALSVFVVGAMVPKAARFAQRRWGWFKGLDVEVSGDEAVTSE